MKKKDVHIGETYLAKVSGKPAKVRIDAISRYGGWDATNLATRKRVRIKSAQRLRMPFAKKAPATTSNLEAAKKCPKCGSDVLAREPNGNRYCPVCKNGKSAKKAKAEPKPPKAKRGPRADGTLSALDSAAKALAEADEPLGCKIIVERALVKGCWKTNGKTPQATLYSAILREIQKKGEQARFRKVERGKFTLAGKGV